MLRVGMMSEWHVHAKGYANVLADMSDVEVCVVWDEEPERGKAWASELGVPFEPQLDAFLARDSIDGVVMCAPTNMHAELMVAAARAGKHIFTEKVMALTVAECNAVATAVREAGVKFCISFPMRTNPDFQFAKQVADDGVIGDITLLRVRIVHNGASAGWLPPHFYDLAACGGGAMMDLGAHPMYLARWILGRPLRVTSSFTRVTGHAVDDNAVTVVEFERGALAVIETGFVSTNSPRVLELHGTQGCLYAGGPGDSLQMIAPATGRSPEAWHTPAELPPALPSPIRMWVEGKRPVKYG